jgi:hypothetical protein
MAPKQRRARLAPRPAPVSPGVAQTSPPRSAPRGGERRDPRASEHVAALYARVPAATKRRLDIAAAMMGCNLNEVVTALLDAHVDPTDVDKQRALQQLLAR